MLLPLSCCFRYCCHCWRYLVAVSVSVLSMRCWCCQWVNPSNRALRHLLAPTWFPSEAYAPTAIAASPFGEVMTYADADADAEAAQGPGPGRGHGQGLVINDDLRHIVWERRSGSRSSNSSSSRSSVATCCAKNCAHPCTQPVLSDAGIDHGGDSGHGVEERIGQLARSLWRRPDRLFTRKCSMATASGEHFVRTLHRAAASAAAAAVTATSAGVSSVATTTRRAAVLLEFRSGGSAGAAFQAIQTMAPTDGQQRWQRVLDYVTG